MPKTVKAGELGRMCSERLGGGWPPGTRLDEGELLVI